MKLEALRDSDWFRLGRQLASSKKCVERVAEPVSIGRTKGCKQLVKADGGGLIPIISLAD